MSQAPAPARQESRGAHVISQVYYYVAAVIGFGLFMGGAIGGLFGVRELVIPRDFETTREGVRTILHGLSFALPGLALMWWHLRQARRREDRPVTTAFWGRALYFHLMALVALVFVLIGGVGLLFNLGDAVTADCPLLGHPSQVESTPGASPTIDVWVESPFLFCHPTAEDSLRSALDSSIFLIVAGPVFWWHLRQGRRLTAPPD